MRLTLKTYTKRFATFRTEAGGTIEAEYLGRGQFTTAYVADDLVYLVVPDDCGDFSKDILESCEPMPHLPTCEKFGMTETGTVWREHLYAPLTRANKQAWADFKTLQKARDEAWAQAQGRNFSVHNGHVVMQTTVDLLPDGPLKNALDELRSAAANYGSSYCFEFAKRNLAVDKDGRLILLDCTFDLETVHKLRTKHRRVA